MDDDVSYKNPIKNKQKPTVTEFKKEEKSIKNKQKYIKKVDDNHYNKNYGKENEMNDIDFTHVKKVKNCSTINDKKSHAIVKSKLNSSISENNFDYNQKSISCDKLDNYEKPTINNDNKLNENDTEDIKDHDYYRYLNVNGGDKKVNVNSNEFTSNDNNLTNYTNIENSDKTVFCASTNCYVKSDSVYNNHDVPNVNDVPISNIIQTADNNSCDYEMVIKKDEIYNQNNHEIRNDLTLLQNMVSIYCKNTHIYLIIITLISVA